LEPPSIYMEKFFLERRRLVERLATASSLDDVQDLVIRSSLLLSPMVATCGPAGPNVAPLMVTFLPRREHLPRAMEDLERIQREYWGQGPRVYQVAARFLLDYVYNPDVSDPLLLGSHLMTRGHTYTNIEATGMATLGILIPPDEAALELRVKAWIEEDGDYYKYINMVHDLMHVVPHGRRSHPWYPALIMRVDKIYDNSYQSLGKLVWERPGA